MRIISKGVDLNTAGLKELAGFLGEDKARRIIQYRKEHGPIKNWKDLETDPDLKEIEILAREKGISLGDYEGDLAGA